MSDHPPIVFVVDDDESVRRALTRLIRSAGYRVEGYASARAFLDRPSSMDAEACLVLDVQLPDLNGLALQRQLNATGVTLPIIFVTAHGDIAMTVNAMKAGAMDFLTKPVGEADLFVAIEAALLHASEVRAHRVEADIILNRLSRLTPREREVLSLLAEGRVNKQVACELGTAVKTIKVHRGRVLEKMETHSLAELVRILNKANVLHMLKHALAH
ncbi:response regulator transcription factor [Caballeronia insecticola]|uniref:Two component transcriptional regulator LuxR family n=1 Tax=Caballeronia insecticola TaxID=758793 RepID=R4X074_9BURK|nr:response regulator [Caballeronia insecticola]BAN27550.1 Two component transcriptional regulator LuxR family [Caballeronia insecticola]